MSGLAAVATRATATTAGAPATTTTSASTTQPPAASGSEREDRAARTIQRVYRGYHARQQVKGMNMKSEARWDDLVKQSGEKSYAKQQLDNKNDIGSRWSRAVHAAARLQEGDGLYTKHSTQPEEYEENPPLSDKQRKDRKATFLGSLSMGIGAGQARDEAEELPYSTKALEQQHWLEMIDAKHRYGSNLKYYFREWKESDTSDNFFRWLDRGDGKDVDLEVLPRQRLEKELITYLSAEQRLNYLVRVDPDGLLRWVHNNELVDTAAGKWKDSGNGTGIIPNDKQWSSKDDDEDDGDDNERDGSDVSSLSSRSDISDSYSAESDLQDNAETHYLGLEEGEKEGWLKRKTKGITPGGIKKGLLRKTLRRNTWIYVSDMKLNMFVGIKQSGTFQHSSFLAGGKVTSAGIIIVKRGLIKSLQPLSGHYRSSIEHYRAFIAQLESKGADLSHVKIGKSVLSLWGLSKYGAATKKEKDLVVKFKHLLGSHEPTELEKSQRLEENARREEAEHQERMKAVREAEDGVQDPREKERVRKEVLYGKQRDEQADKQQDASEVTTT